MKIRDKEKLLGFMSQKCEKLQEYYSVSEELIGEELEKVAESISKRQKIIESIDSVSKSINDIIAKQKEDIKTTLNQILSHKDCECPEIFAEIKTKSDEIESILIKISENEAKVKTHIEGIRTELFDGMKKSVDSKKVIDFYNSATKKPFTGNNLNVLN